MKSLYESPLFSVENLLDVDVITASNGHVNDDEVDNEGYVDQWI